MMARSKIRGHDLMKIISHTNVPFKNNLFLWDHIVSHGTTNEEDEL
jgi:hypothetical protein